MKRKHSGFLTVAALAVACLLTLAALPSRARADTAQAGSDAELRQKIADGETSIALTAGFTTSAALDASGATIYVNGQTWRVTAAVTGTVDTSASGSLVLCSGNGSVSSNANNVWYARTLTLEGASDGEQVTDVTVDGASASRLYTPGAVSGGSVTVYLPYAEYNGNVSAVTTGAAAYRLSSGNLSRVYAITYYADSTKQKTLNLSPVSYTASDAAFALATPQMQGAQFTGWTSSTIATPQTSVTVPAGTSGNLEFVANWQQRSGGSGGGGWSGSLSGLTTSGDDAEESTDTQTASAEETAVQEFGAGRKKKASSTTKVTFSDGTNAAVMPSLETVGQTGGGASPWIYIGCGTVAAAGVAGLCIRASRKKRDAEKEAAKKS